jgi:hypothetical protein
MARRARSSERKTEKHKAKRVSAPSRQKKLHKPIKIKSTRISHARSHSDD